ncbi:uncharacterized protein LOC133904329 [Phragmites australis]|uniref:uncharacterized protein LOC133904329 n=1 Tax=Phragmites australis TaxID=29695 RepID=UPI002D799D07|nr:uncharacterized protein LOC133904329 [Phragmites australis]
MRKGPQIRLGTVWVDPASFISNPLHFGSPHPRKAMAAASSSWILPTLPECDDAPGWVLLDMRCYIADRPNATTATGVTSSGLPIQVTFRAARPPILSYLCVHCPGMEFPGSAPKVVATHADLVLLRVPINPDALFFATTRFWDYFVYRAHPPLLDLLPNPYPKRFNDSSAALLGRDGGGGYVVAALRSRVPRRDPNGGALIRTEFDLHLYRSSNADEGWISKRLSVEEPVRDTLVPLPDAVADDMLYHETGKTITVGGKRGTVAWVDLWRGILLCNLLDECPVLRDVPLPLPARGNWDRLLQECNPNFLRDITISRHKDSIKYIEIEIRPPRELKKTTRDSYLEWVRQNSRNSQLVRRDGWRATTWSMPLPVGSWEDWRCECDVDVNALTIDAKAILHSLSVAYPTISMDDDAVYLLSKVDNLEVVVAVDVRKNTLRGVAELDIQKDFSLMPTYCSSEISSYLLSEEDYRHIRSA